MIEPEFKIKPEVRTWKLTWLGEWTEFSRGAVGTVRWWKFETKNRTWTLEVSEGRVSFEYERYGG